MQILQQDSRIGSMRSPTLKDLPPPPSKGGWPWTEESAQLPDKMPDGRPWPRMSIVTPSLNQGQYIEETIRSVLLQGYPNLEYVIIDGGSTDDTIEIIKKYEKWLTHWVSEPDEGQSAAINKGFERSTGVIGAWINSDDLYETQALENVAGAFLGHENLAILYGDCTNIDATGNTFSISRSRSYERDRLIRYWPNYIAQPTAFFRLTAFKSLGGLDSSLRFAMDYDLWIRLGTKGSGLYLPLPIARFRVHHDSKTNRGPSAYWAEMRRVSRRHGGNFFSPMFLKYMRDRFYLFRQRVKRGIRWH
jgi:glycosyltransferase involved in cell wall biosynthesis